MAMAVPLMCCAADMISVPSRKQVVLVGHRTCSEFDDILAAAHASYDPNKTIVAMEPSNEDILRVKRTQTTLVLGGTTSSALSPDLLTDGSIGLAPSQRDTVISLASILAPSLCLSTISSKFRVSVLYGPIRYLPTIIVLHHFDVFRNLMSHPNV